MKKLKFKDMKFENRPNLEHKLPDGRTIWESRSVAVLCVLLGRVKDDPKELYVLCSKRGAPSPDFVGYENLPAGYLDWNENGFKAIYRETWEETGLDLPDFFHKVKVLENDLLEPWKVNTSPDSNRQNVTLRYGMFFEIESVKDLPELTTKYNEVEGETEDPQWLKLSDMDEYKWAFNHDGVVWDYIMGLTFKGHEPQ